jgi:hypothetical protein
MIYEVTSSGHVRRYHEEPRRVGCDVLVDRDFREVSATHPRAVYFQLHRDVAELMRTWDGALYARVKHAMPRIFETAVCLLMLSNRAPDANPREQLRRVISVLRKHNAECAQRGDDGGRFGHQPLL